MEKQLLALLDQLRERAEYAQGYGPANVLALLRALRGHLRGLDLSQLSIRGAYVQRVEMQDTTLAEATLRDTAFTEALDDSWAVATSLDGTYWAAGGRRGEVRVWRQKEKLLHLAWQAHFGTVRALAFSPDGATLASASCDCAIKLWNLKSGALLWAGQHTSSIQCLAFAPDGRTLASAGDDATVRLWDATSGTNLQTLTGHGGRMEACSLVGASTGRFDCGNNRGRSQNPLCRCWLLIPIGYWGWPLPPMGKPWPARVGTAPSSCGTWQACVCARRSLDTPTG